MNEKELKQKSDELRLRLIDLVFSGKTGHTGGDLSVLNLLTVLYNRFLNIDPSQPQMAGRDRFVLSKGHCAEALYCVLCDKGFIPESWLQEYGRKGALLGGHPTVKIPGVEINTGALGHGLSAGVGMALGAKMSKETWKTYVVMGDGEQAEGSIYEAAMAANKYHLDHLVAFIDRNGLQISGATETVMPLESIRERWTAFGWDVMEMNGDDIGDIVRTIENIDFTNGKPHLIISHTTKGFGVSFMENVAKWHHGVPTEEQYLAARAEIASKLEDYTECEVRRTKHQDSVQTKKTIPCRKSFTDTLLRLALEDRDIIAVTSDASGSATLTDFAKTLPEQFVEVGIAEQNAVGISAGLSSTGKKTFIFGPACFYVARALEQVKVDMAYSQMPVKICGVSGGVAYSQLGATHHSLHDIAVLRTFPGMEVYLPCDARETKKLVEKMVNHPKPAYIRVGRNAVPDVYDNDDFEFELGKANQLMDGTDLTLIGTGETVWHCLEAGKILKEKGIHARVLDMHSLKPFDRDAVIKAARETRLIVTVEEHSIYGGLGATVAEIVAQECPVRMKILGIPDENVIHASPLEVYHHYGIDAEGILKAVLDHQKT